MTQEKEINIVALEFPENIKKRSGMWVGPTNEPDVILREIIDNSIDELMNSNAGNKVDIQIKSGQKGGWYVVADNGRGIPIQLDPNKGITKTELATGTTSAGSKFSKGVGDITTGLNGCGSKCFPYDTELIVLNKRTNCIESLKIGDLVTNHLKDNYLVLISSTEYRPIKDAFKTKEVSELIELEFEDSTIIKCTPDHRFKLISGEFKEAKDLTEDDEVDTSILSFNLQDLLDRNIDDICSPLVYKITNNITGKSYIGSTTYSLYSRFLGGNMKITHEYCINDPSCNSNLYNDIRLYTPSKFTVSILYIGHRDYYDLNKIEYYNITKFDSYNSGYNQTEDGLGGFQSRSVLREMRARCKAKGAGFYDSQLQSELGKRAALVRVPQMIENKELFFNSEFQSEMSYRNYYNRIKYLYNNLKDEVDIDELSWNKSKYRDRSNDPSYRSILYRLDELINIGILPEDAKQFFTVSKLYKTPNEVAYELYGWTQYNYSWAWRIYDHFKYLKDNNYKLCQENWDALKSNNIPTVENLKTDIDKLIKCGYVTSDDFNELISADNSNSIIDKLRIKLPEMNVIEYRRVMKIIDHINYMIDNNIEITYDSWRSTCGSRTISNPDSLYEYINWIISGGLLNETQIEKVSKISK